MSKASKDLSGKRAETMGKREVCVKCKRVLQVREWVDGVGPLCSRCAEVANRVVTARASMMIDVAACQGAQDEG